MAELQGQSTVTAMVPSPCIDVCELDEHNLCVGCLRSGNEIMAWPSLNIAGKQAVLELVGQRRRVLEKDALGG